MNCDGTFGYGTELNAVTRSSTAAVTILPITTSAAGVLFISSVLIEKRCGNESEESNRKLLTEK